MAWLILLLQLLPSLIQIVGEIMKLIQARKGQEKTLARRELFSLAKKHIRKKRGEDAHSLTYGAATAKAEFQALHDKLKAG